MAVEFLDVEFLLALVAHTVGRLCKYAGDTPRHGRFHMFISSAHCPQVPGVAVWRQFHRSEINNLPTPHRSLSHCGDSFGLPAIFIFRSNYLYRISYCHLARPLRRGGCSSGFVDRRLLIELGRTGESSTT
jgi:hypothetical protein